MVPIFRIFQHRTFDVTCSRMKGLTLVGEWLSLVEHLVRDQGVGGSNPLSPTNLSKYLQRFAPGAFWVRWAQLARAG